MNAGERFDNLNMINKMVLQTGVESIWNLTHFVKSAPPLFKFDYAVAYAILGLVGRATLAIPFPVGINKETISELYEIPLDNVEDYFVWLCRIGILRRF